MPDCRTFPLLVVTTSKGVMVILLILPVLFLKFLVTLIVSLFLIGNDVLNFVNLFVGLRCENMQITYVERNE